MKTWQELVAEYDHLAGAAARLGQSGTADVIHDLLVDVATTFTPYLNTLSESEAVLRSGKSRNWLRAEARRVWIPTGDAWVEGGQYRFREIVVPVRSKAKDARRAAREARKAA